MAMTSRVAVEAFLELQAGVPQNGPGSRASAERALAAVGALPAAPRILDMGCGTGRQTLDLTQLVPDARIEAVDRIAALLRALERRAIGAGVAQRIRTQRASMLDEAFARDPAELIWSEGAIYNVGLREGLKTWRRFLKPGGAIAFTEACWLRGDPGSVTRAFWNEAYPAMRSVGENLAVLEELGFECLDHFPLPDSDWWAYYRPLEQLHRELTQRYAGQPEALASLAGVPEEIELYRQHGADYGYVFYVVRPGPSG